METRNEINERCIFICTKNCPLGRVRKITKNYNFQGYLSSSAEFLQVEMIFAIRELKFNIKKIFLCHFPLKIIGLVILA